MSTVTLTLQPLFFRCCCLPLPLPRQSYLLADEEFCMQTDSHMDFVEGWDVLMMEEWAQTDNE